jgi:hypothetical protein
MTSVLSFWRVISSSVDSCRSAAETLRSRLERSYMAECSAVWPDSRVA